MYIWTAINVDEQLRHLKNKTSEVTEKLCTINTALSLPLHISLRISFPVEDAIFEEVIDRISNYYVSLTAFDVVPNTIEKYENIVWLNINRNNKLNKIHNDLVDIIQLEFGIPPYDYDKAYLYHVTLFTGEDNLKADSVYSCLRNEYFPDVLSAQKLVIGCSQSGLSGEYYVIKTFDLL